ncbi:MAG TPA: hypothetical protein VHX16_07595 [Chloroflexota bacterium]|jgi:hypothetical protein|nr:hypothetical protein [Chloroflexota bacterium]
MNTTHPHIAARSGHYPPGSPHSRNASARQCELEGKVDEAVELYELNVRDGSVAILPYDRLRVIYVQRNQLASAIRVCQAAIKALETQPKVAQRFENVMARLIKRARWSMSGLDDMTEIGGSIAEKNLE